MNLKIKRLTKNAVIPTRAHPTDGGLDLTATSKEWDAEKGLVVMGTGLAISVPPGHVGLLFPRSSICKTSYRLANSVGVLDENYTGEVKFMFQPIEAFGRKYEVGDRIGQLVVLQLPKIEVVEVTDLDDSDRGTGSFGSSGK